MHLPGRTRHLPSRAPRHQTPARIGPSALRRLGLACACLLGAGLACELPAQELSLLGGQMNTSKLEQSSYTWQLDYRQELNPNLAASIAYINEGHVIGHHRDGSAFELWAQLPFAHDKFSFGLGAGGYYYYDTQSLAGGGSLDLHGTAPIVSLSFTGYTSHRWFYRVIVNHISPAHDIKVNTAAVGAGFWFGADRKPTRGELGDTATERAYVTEHELTAFAGQSVVNTLFSESARAYGFEYRRGFSRHLDGTLSYIYEGDPEIVRRSGAAIQAWAVNSFFDDRVGVGVGLGPYFYIDRKNPRPGYQKIPAAIAPLASLTVSYRFSKNWLTRIVWNRVTTSYNRDADVFLVGVGYRWAD